VLATLHAASRTLQAWLVAAVKAPGLQREMQYPARFALMPYFFLEAGLTMLIPGL
jgi:hypothetical protein